MHKSIEIHGTVHAKFEQVKNVFHENFVQREELGASCVVIHKGQCVVDLWGGYRDVKRTLPWEKDTRTLVFSSTKSVTSLAIALLVTRGQLDFNQKVAHYWPEFAANGKGNITVRELLNHRAGLSMLDVKLTPEILKNKEKLSHILSEQKPQLMGENAYHAQTIGWYLSELCHRSDPKKRYLTQFIQEEISDPYDVEVQLSLNEPTLYTVAQIKDFNPILLWLCRKETKLATSISLLMPKTVTYRAMKNPKLNRPRDLMSEKWRTCEMPASNGYASARGLAKMYDLLLSDHFLSISVKNELFKTNSVNWDHVLHAFVSYNLGFMHHHPDKWRFGSTDKALGFCGMGGSFAFADPDSQTTYAYVPNKMGSALWNDPRERSLREATMACVSDIA